MSERSKGRKAVGDIVAWIVAFDSARAKAIEDGQQHMTVNYGPLLDACRRLAQTNKTRRGHK